MESRKDAVSSHIEESPFIRTILKKLSFNSWLLLDLDNTSIENLTLLGRDQWFCKLIEYACTIIPEKQEAIACVIAIYHEVQHHLRVKAVEANLVFIIAALKKIGIPVIGLTARGGELKNTTLRQLSEIGISFDRIIFCDGKDKGTCLKADLLNSPEWPQHIVMADDKEKHLLHVASAAQELGIKFDGVRYSYLDEKIKTVDLHEAHYQLAQIQTRFPESTREIISRLKLCEHFTQVPAPAPDLFHLHAQPLAQDTKKRSSATLYGNISPLPKQPKQPATGEAPGVVVNGKAKPY